MIFNTPQESLQFIKDVCREHGMLESDQASLTQLSIFLNRIYENPKHKFYNNYVSREKKIDNQKKHFKLRFFQRVGYILTDDKYKILCDLTKTSGKFIKKHEGSTDSIFKVNFDKVLLKVVYNPFDNVLITVLP